MNGLRGRDATEPGEEDWKVLLGDAYSFIRDGHPCNPGTVDELAFDWTTCW
jgi:hypothetical protein